MADAVSLDEIKRVPWTTIVQTENLKFPPFRAWVTWESNQRWWSWGLQHDDYTNNSPSWFSVCQGSALTREKAVEAVFNVLSVALYIQGQNSGR